jgi:LemA protein
MIQMLVVIGLAAVVVLLVGLSTYNHLSHLRDEVRLAWAAMDEQLKLRYQLTSELVMRVQHIGGDLVNSLSSITTAKNEAVIAFNPAHLAAAENALSAAIHQLLGNKQAGSGLAEIETKLLRSERAIEISREKYNACVMSLNDSLKTFPTNLTARVIGLKSQPVFAESAGESAGDRR